MGWAQIIAMIAGLGGGLLAGRGDSSSAPLTADQVEMQSLMKSLLRSQVNDSDYGATLRNHITDTADWLLPKRSRNGGPGVPWNTGDGGVVIDKPTGPTGTQPPNAPGQYHPPFPTPIPDGSGPAPPPSKVDPQAVNYMAQYLSKYRG